MAARVGAGQTPVLVGALPEREGAVAVAVAVALALALASEGDQKLVQRWGDVDGTRAEGESDAFFGGENLAGGEAGDLGDRLAVGPIVRAGSGRGAPP
ncbi:hypothetical protein ACIF85_34800 [Streptomyces sp. NPDC086033]|uniref:hypothetical protein n=1 Tax=Streptomyces sp. NPDC086033 TaxID=3365747 RepID=UPI0037CEB5B1